MNLLQGRSELEKRVATGVVGAAALLSLVIFGGVLGISILTAVLSLAMIYEFVDITCAMPDRVEKRYLLLCVAWFVNLFHYILGGAQYELFVLSFLILFIYFLFTAKRYENELFVAHFKELMFVVFGLLYVVFIPLYLPEIRMQANGLHWVITFLLIVWAGDTGAYFAGKRFGKRKLYPVISPKKTVEGSMGGLAAGLVVVLLYKLLIFRQMSWLAWFFAPIFVGVVAQIGDLCESYLKRVFGKKDSGRILPGHGGFLDRFDGVVFSLPVMYACIRLLG